MLPLYALGVMLSFSLSQFGMFRLMEHISHLRRQDNIVIIAVPYLVHG